MLVSKGPMWAMTTAQVAALPVPGRYTGQVAGEIFPLSWSGPNLFSRLRAITKPPLLQSHRTPALLLRNKGWVWRQWLRALLCHCFTLFLNYRRPREYGVVGVNHRVASHCEVKEIQTNKQPSLLWDKQTNHKVSQCLEAGWGWAVFSAWPCWSLSGWAARLSTWLGNNRLMGSTLRSWRGLMCRNPMIHLWGRKNLFLATLSRTILPEIASAGGPSTQQAGNIPQFYLTINCSINNPCSQVAKALRRNLAKTVFNETESDRHRSKSFSRVILHPLLE